MVPLFTAAQFQFDAAMKVPVNIPVLDSTLACTLLSTPSSRNHNEATTGGFRQVFRPVLSRGIPH